MSDTNKMFFQVPARVLKCAPTEALKERARGTRYVDETVFDEMQPFFFSAEISNNSLDAYFTRMSSNTLQNFADDAREGITLCDSHVSRRLGLGRSLSGKYEKDGEIERVIADFYTVRGLNFNDATYQKSDDFIAAIRAGIASDVSVGFYGGTWICSVCQVDMWDWESGCMHWPGDEVNIKDSDGNTVRVETVFAWIADARLSEVSIVYDGATPGAMIVKAERAIEAGEMRSDRIHALEQRFRIKLPDARPYVLGKPQERSNPMAENKDQPATVADIRNAVLAEVRAALTTAGHNPGEGDILAFIRTIPTERTSEPNEVESALKRALEAAAVADAERCADFKDLASVEGVRTLAALAADGRRYREDLITEALAEGVRAHGDKFAEETYRTMLNRSDIETIKRMRDDWKETGDRNFPGGRLSQEEGEPTSKTARALDLAYQS